VSSDIPTAAGDVSGDYGNLSVDKIKGKALTMTSLASGNFLKYDGSKWINSIISAADITDGTLAMARGGTGTGLSAQNGGIVYSNASTLDIWLKRRACLVASESRERQRDSAWSWFTNDLNIEW
jgi:hypothetical protein